MIRELERDPLSSSILDETYNAVHGDDTTRIFLSARPKLQSLFCRVASPEEADFVLVPFRSSLANGNAEAHEYMIRSLRTGVEANKKTILISLSDETVLIPPEFLDNHVIDVCSALQKRSLRQNSLACPAWIPDLLREELQQETLSGTPPPVSAPIVGFCGYAPLCLRSGILNLPEKLHDALQSRFSFGHAARRISLELLSRSPSVQTDFLIRRNHFWKSKNGRQRDEFLRNLINCHYALCVRGNGNYSFRLYEALSVGSIPVLLDTDCVLPWHEEIDYRSYFPVIPETRIFRLPQLIRAHFDSGDADRFQEQRLNCRRLWLEHLSIEGFFSHFHDWLLSRKSFS